MEFCCFPALGRIAHQIFTNRARDAGSMSVVDQRIGCDVGQVRVIHLVLVSGGAIGWTHTRGCISYNLTKYSYTVIGTSCFILRSFVNRRFATDV